MVDCEGISLGSSCAKLPHSHSADIPKTPPPGQKNAGKMLAIRVVMLDDNITLFQVQAKALGRVLFEQVCKQLNLLEADYFGLEYQDHSGTRYWLDLEKQLSRQVGLTLVEPLLHFCVKFYTPDPAQLEEEYTRYLFCLQIKRDLAQGHIQCNDNTAALMASYIVQAECGDYNADDYPDASYLSTYKFVQHQDRELEKKIMDNHKKGQPPAEADLNLLETARRCELYGMKMHPVKDHEGVPLNLAVAHMGIVVFQNYSKIYTFSWAKVRKISFKRKKFLIKLHPDGYGYYKDTVEFFFETRNECKNLWKKCVENHGFFRCNAVKRAARQRTRVLSRGSSFRYSGKTQKQMVEFVRENYVKRQNFQRSQSFRQSSSVHSSVATNVGGSISAHPLIPLGDNSIVSASCGSMVLAGEDSPSLTYPADLTTRRHSSRTRLPLHRPLQHQQESPLVVSNTTASVQAIISTNTGLPSYNTTSSQTDIVDFVESSSTQTPHSSGCYSWQRSSSAKELRKAKTEEIEPSLPPKSRNFAIAGSKTPSFDRDQETKIYSSSYPGTTSSLSTESAEEIEPGGSVLVIDTGSSRDDLSHDSYELLEREGYSRSCSVGSSGAENQEDELFAMDDFKDDDVIKRLGYLEPRYRDIGFSEFNEQCKRGFARRAIEFDEFEAKCVSGSVIRYDKQEDHHPVERTKSEPFVSDFWRVAREHKRLFHQKSFDYTPVESYYDTTSKSTADIPYTLHKRQPMNGTCYECRSPVSPKMDREPKRSKDRFNSQDSGLSLSLGAESVDELEEHKSILKQDKRKLTPKKDLLKVSSEDGTRNKNILVKTKALSADSGLRRAFDHPVEVIKIPSQDGEGIVICSSDDKNISLDTSDPDVIIVEYHTKRKRAFQKRSSSDSKSSVDKKRGGSLDSPCEKITIKNWKSESSSSCDVQDKSEFKQSAKTNIEGKVVRESLEEKELKKQKSEELYRQKTEELRKQKSEELQRQKSEEMQKKIERRQEVLEQLRQKHEELNKIEVIKVEEVKKPKLGPKPVQKQERIIEVSPKPIHKTPDKIILQVPVEINATESQLGYCMCDSPTKEVEVMPKVQEVKEPEVNEEKKGVDGKQVTSPEATWKKFGDASIAKRERSPVLFARLGFSDGSVFPAKVLSPNSARRAKSLDTPVVSLHRLPPVTSFSSKDDTVDNDEDIELEEKALCSIKPRENVIEEEDISSLSPLLKEPEKLPESELESIEKVEDEQKVPESQFFDSDPSEVDEEYINDVFENKELDEDVENEEVFIGAQPERRPSTRQERLDSFKNTKSYSVDIWTSEETEAIPTVDVEDVDGLEDNVDEFIEPPFEVEHENETEELDAPLFDAKVEIPLAEICEKMEPPDMALIPPKRSFDEDASSSSSIKPEKSPLKPFSLESSGSSSLEEGIFPQDDSSHFADEEEGSSNSAKDEYQGFGYSVAGADLVIGGYTGVFALSRTLSRISERSTTSEQERSDFDDDLSTKPSSRSLSMEDESLMSSDRQPSLSSDHSIDEQPLPPLPPESLGFKIPPPLLQQDEDWPSPPNSSFNTPLVSNVETYYMDIKPEEATKVVLPREYYESSSSDSCENKTLQDEPDSSTKESTIKLVVKQKKGNSSDTSLGISDFSSSTSTLKHHYCPVKSDDSSLADFGSSLSTEMLASSRKNSDDSTCFRRRSYQIQRRSFDDYDSPYSESDESCPKQKRIYANLPSPTSCSRRTPKQERRSPGKDDRKNCTKSIARAKCYSYYSLTRSPPSDGSSSSLEMGEPPTTPNTIPRVSKRRRIPPKRRHRTDDVKDGHLISSSSPSVACIKRSPREPRAPMSKQSSV